MTLCFELSMPNVGSWNGQWSGRERLHAKLVRIPNSSKGAQKAADLLKKGYWYYNFGDGWGAGVSVRAVEPAEARRIRTKSSGFCGYDWMVDSILSDGDIYSALRPKPSEVTP